MNHKQATKLRAACILIVLVSISALFLAACGAEARAGESSATDISRYMNKDTSSITLLSYEPGGVRLKPETLQAVNEPVNKNLKTCSICSDSGQVNYLRQKDMLICQICGNAVNPDLKGEKNGCNPVHIIQEISKQDDGKTLTLSEENTRQNMKILFNRETT